MKISLASSFLFVAVPAIVRACEGECIVKITQAYLSNYTAHVQSVFEDIAQQVGQELVHQPASEALGYLRPLLTAYDNASYSGMETAIFPSYFHGKCQRNGVDPPGCPNPDCPVVCGTPGSLVHFFPKLRYIAYNQTLELLKGLTRDGTPAYEQVERTIVQEATKAPPTRRSSLPEHMSRRAVHARASEDVKNGLKKIMQRIPGEMEKSCGGRASDDQSALPDCSWEEAMKAFILTFP